MAVKVSKTPLIANGSYTVQKVAELNFFMLDANKIGVKGTSNKFFHIELQIESVGPRAQIYTEYGPTGFPARKEWRHYQDKFVAGEEYEKILKSKRKKGYKDIDIAQRAIGSEESKKITKTVILKNAEHLKINQNSTLHPETIRFINEIMGATNQFVIQTLKCPLGQLTNAQIDTGREILNKAKLALQNNKKNILLDLTNEFYALIPHNLGAGARGILSNLLLDDVQKIAQKEDDLDTLLDAKSVGAILVSNDINEKYKSLNSQLNWIDPKSELFQWINSIVLGTRASNHRHLGKITVRNAWELNRNTEKSRFIKRAQEIAQECGKQNIPSNLKPYMKRIDVSSEDAELYKHANVLPLFHGTRTQNLTGIIKNGLLIRPAGVVLCGSMYGNAIYKSSNSTKSINYTNIKSSYWAKGSSDHAYLFLNDCALGSTKIASGSYQYTRRNILPHHSVWAVGGKSGVLNDEMMLYDTNQHLMRYVIEFSC